MNARVVGHLLNKLGELSRFQLAQKWLRGFWLPKSGHPNAKEMPFAGRERGREDWGESHRSASAVEWTCKYQARICTDFGKVSLHTFPGCYPSYELSLQTCTYNSIRPPTSRIKFLWLEPEESVLLNHLACKRVKKDAWTGNCNRQLVKGLFASEDVKWCNWLRLLAGKPIP